MFTSNKKDDLGHPIKTLSYNLSLISHRVQLAGMGEILAIAILV